MQVSFQSVVTENDCEAMHRMTRESQKGKRRTSFDEEVLLLLILRHGEKRTKIPAIDNYFEYT